LLQCPLCQRAHMKSQPSQQQVLFACSTAAAAAAPLIQR
jgi:hypothetical protein